MALTHVYEWNKEIGFTPITAEEAAKNFPDHGVSAQKEIFLCKLCNQYVTLTAPGKNIRHFRHSSAAQNKECEERQKYIKSFHLTSFKAPYLPIRLHINNSNFQLQLGFFLPRNNNELFECNKIKIVGDYNQNFEYSFDRIESEGISYLSVGSLPSKEYKISYENSTSSLSSYWPSVVTGISPEGTFFNTTNNKMLPLGSKALTNQKYYFLQRLSSPNLPKISGLSIQLIAEEKLSLSHSWYLYLVEIQNFTKEAARFFLQRSIFLTEKPACFYSIWPPCIQDNIFIYHSNEKIYFYLQNNQAELKIYPAEKTYNFIQSFKTSNGLLYSIFSSSKKQLVSLGINGSLGFTYILKTSINKEISYPKINIKDKIGNILQENSYTQLPKSKKLYISASFDGKVVIYKNKKLKLISKIFPNETFQINNISYGTVIKIFQGCDCIETIGFNKKQVNNTASFIKDQILLNKLKSSSNKGQLIKIPHSFGAAIKLLSNYPHSKQWFSNVIRKGKISTKAYKTLVKEITNLSGGL